MEENNEILNNENTEDVATEESAIIEELAVTEDSAVVEETVAEENLLKEKNSEESVNEAVSEETATEAEEKEENRTSDGEATEGVSTEATAEETAEETPAEETPKKPRKKRTKKTEEETENEEPALPKPDCPEAAIEAVLFATGNSVSIEQLADILNMQKDEVRSAIANLKIKYDSEDRGITITELEDSVQLGTKGEYYEYLMKLAKHPKHYSLSDTVIETLSIVAYKQPVTRGEIEKIRGVSCDHALNKLLEYELIEEVGRLDAPGKPLLFGTTEQFLRSFGVKSIGELPTVSPEMVEDFKTQAEAEAAEDLELEQVKVDV